MKNRTIVQTISGSALALIFLAGLGMAGGIAFVGAQTHTPDSAMQRARQETQVVLDLGRLFTFVDRMDTEQTNLRLSAEQARQLVRLMGEIRSTARLTPATAERMTTEIEDSILTPRQLLFTDRIWAESERNAGTGNTGTAAGSSSGAVGARTPGSGTGPRSGQSASATGGSDPAPGGSVSGGSDPAPGSLASYASGGPYNPLIDTARPQGEQFEEFYQRLRTRSGQ